MADPNIAPEMGERKPQTFEKALTAHPDVSSVSGDGLGETGHIAANTLAGVGAAANG